MLQYKSTKLPKEIYPTTAFSPGVPKLGYMYP